MNDDVNIKTAPHIDGYTWVGVVAMKINENDEFVQQCTDFLFSTFNSDIQILTKISSHKIQRLDGYVKNGR